MSKGINESITIIEDWLNDTIEILNLIIKIITYLTDTITLPLRVILALFE